MLDKKLVSFETESESFVTTLRRLAKQGEILINMEILNPPNRPPEDGLSLHLKDVTVREVLDILIETVEHRYNWQPFEDSRVVSVVPTEKRDAPGYLPNRLIDSFKHKELVPLLCMQSLFPSEVWSRRMMAVQGSEDAQPTFRLHVQNVTVRHILNSMSKATSFIWSYFPPVFSLWGMTSAGRIRARYTPHPASV